jgi:hypothetical protein
LGAVHPAYATVGLRLAVFFRCGAGQLRGYLPWYEQALALMRRQREVLDMDERVMQVNVRLLFGQTSLSLQLAKQLFASAEAEHLH